MPGMPELPHTVPTDQKQVDGDQKENWRQEGLTQTHRGFRFNEAPELGTVPDEALRYPEETQ